jgi:coiled-coil domain-containing protein 39
VVIATEKKVLAVKSSAAESKERVTVMKEHLRNVIQEIGHTQKLLEAKTREVKGEEHLKSLAEREIGRLRQETRRLDGRADEIRDALNNVQNAIFKGSEQLEQFKVRFRVCLCGMLRQGAGLV